MHLQVQLQPQAGPCSARLAFKPQASREATRCTVARFKERRSVVCNSVIRFQAPQVSCGGGARLAGRQRLAADAPTLQPLAPAKRSRPATDLAQQRQRAIPVASCKLRSAPSPPARPPRGQGRSAVSGPAPHPTIVAWLAGCSHAAPQGNPLTAAPPPFPSPGAAAERGRCWCPGKRRQRLHPLARGDAARYCERCCHLPKRV